MTIDLSQIDPDAVKVVQRLRRFGFEAFLVGGCVRDLLLGRKPKDFDVSTSATPPELRRLFRNCRIIGRRFRLAHIFFGPKIFETSTFRANPRELEEDDKAGGEVSEDLLIRRDNVFGTAEQDAQRRDFTINGLFLDPESGQVTDYVNGMADIEARMVRTIGDPDIRFREDPIRILRAVKFAARCNLSIEEETLRCMVEHAQEISKCAQARVSEEFFRLLRAGASHRSMELLVELKLLPVMMPALDAWRQGYSVPGGRNQTAPAGFDGPRQGFDSDDDGHESESHDSQSHDGQLHDGQLHDDGRLHDSQLHDNGSGDRESQESLSLENGLTGVDSASAQPNSPTLQEGANAGLRSDISADPQRLWTYLDALDKVTSGEDASPSNAVVIATLVMPWLYQALAPGSASRDAGSLVANSLRAFIEQLRISRRDAENTRQLLLMLRHFIPSREAQRRRPPRISNRDLASDLTWMVKVVARAEVIPLEGLPELEAPAALPPPTVETAPAPKMAGVLSAIPILPEDWLRPYERPRFLGTGCFGSTLASTWRYAE